MAQYLNLPYQQLRENEMHYVAKTRRHHKDEFH